MKTFLHIFALFLSTHTAYSDIFPWSINEGGNGHYYEVVLFDPSVSSRSWSLADSIAKSRGGYLATITSEAENDFIVSLILKPEFWSFGNGWWNGPWIGGKKVSTSNPAESWQWVTGEEFSFTDWHIGQPDNYQMMFQDRIHFWDEGANMPFSQIDPQWDDAANFFSSSINSFVIEYNSIPEPTVIGLLLFAVVLASLRCSTNKSP